MKAFEIRYKLGERLGMLIAICDSPDDIPLVMANNGLKEAEIQSVGQPRIKIKLDNCQVDSK